jgi:hypothetical protein
MATQFVDASAPSAYQGDYPYTPPQADPITGGGGPAPATLALYTNEKGGAMLYEDGNYRWLQPSEVSAAKVYVLAGKGKVEAVSDARWADLVKYQLATGSSGMATRDVPTGTRGRLEGFDAGKLADLSHRSPKYVFARIASNFNQADPAQRQAMLQMLRMDPSGYFKNATLVGPKGDQLYLGTEIDPKFEGINQFDVGLGAGAGWRGWGWQPSGGPGYKPEVAPPASTVTPPAAFAGFTAANVPPTTYTPRDYGPPPAFAPLDPYATMSPEAYRLLAQGATQMPMSSLTKR